VKFGRRQEGTPSWNETAPRTAPFCDLQAILLFSLLAGKAVKSAFSLGKFPMVQYRTIFEKNKDFSWIWAKILTFFQEKA